jgi:hypothetical protein
MHRVRKNSENEPSISGWRADVQPQGKLMSSCALMAALGAKFRDSSIIEIRKQMSPFGAAVVL